MNKKGRLLVYFVIGFAWFTFLAIVYLAYVKLKLLLHW